MASLSNNTISSTYQSLLKTIDNTGLSLSLKEISDGNGIGSGVYLNSSGILAVNTTVRIGSSQEMFISHNGTASNITNNVGGLNITTSDNLILQDVLGNKWMMTNQQGSVNLYHGSDNIAAKLITTSTGINITGRISQLSDPQAAQDAATKNYVDNKIPYTSLVQLVTQSGSNNPTAAEVYNNTGQTYVWTRVSAGQFRITATGTPFTNNKTVVFVNGGSSENTFLPIYWERVDSNKIDLLTYDDELQNASFEIKIYN